MPPSLPTLTQLGLDKSKKKTCWWCKCPTYCAAFSAHPLGNPLSPADYDHHRVTEVVRLMPSYIQGYDSAVHGAAGLPSPAELLERERPALAEGACLVAIGDLACDEGEDECQFTAEEWKQVGLIEGNISEWDGQCRVHRLRRGYSNCTSQNYVKPEPEAAEARPRPFDLLIRWTPDEAVPDWSALYRWREPTPPPAETPADGQAAIPQPELITLPLPTTSAQPQPLASTSASISSALPTPYQSPSPRPSASTSTAPKTANGRPAKKPRLSSARAGLLAAYQRELEEEEAREEAERQREQERLRLEAEAARKLVERGHHGRWLREYQAKLQEACAAGDASEGWAVWQGWMQELARREREERAALFPEQ